MASAVVLEPGGLNVERVRMWHSGEYTLTPILNLYSLSVTPGVQQLEVTFTYSQRSILCAFALSHH